ncbi:MAG: bacterioferritin-associated ferredoxin [Actinomycetota bacterium]|nr:bacterioferritin-associated ferredoxin [Actinomycetota bacterium]
MYACLCRAVTDRTVREVVLAGASTVSEVRATCGAGTGCGGCLPSLRRLLRECLGADAVRCTGSAVLEMGRGLNLEPSCSANCADATAGGEPMCVAGLRDCADTGCPSPHGPADADVIHATLSFA